MKTKLLILALATLALAGCDDYEVAMTEAREYCKRLERGEHSDYKNQGQYCGEVIKL